MTIYLQHLAALNISSFHTMLVLSSSLVLYETMA